jgi:sigma-B regulation protein RsbU (phosphoserine phosphatase)
MIRAKKSKKTLRQAQGRPPDSLPVLRSRVTTLRGLIEVSSAINTMLDYDQLLASIMDVAKRVMNAEASALLLLDQQTNELVIRTVQGGGDSDIIKEIRIPSGAGIAGAVVTTGKPVNVPDVTKDPRFFGDVDKKSGFKTRAILAVPMIHQGKVIGVLEVLNPKKKKAFDEFDLEPFEAFASMATTAIERARMTARLRNQDRLDQELAIARQIQKSFLPVSSPCADNCLRVRAFYEPAREVSGDFYDFLECDQNHFGILIADVSGKGVPAALQMARATSHIRSVASQCIAPSKLLAEVNAFLCRNPIGGIFITMACAFFDRARKVMRVSSAGHHAPLCWRDGAFLTVPTGDGIPLGILDGAPYTEAEMEARPGDLFLWFTDGLIEARNPARQEFGLDEVKRIMAAAGSDPDLLIEELVGRVNGFMKDAPRHDDLTLVAAKLS